MQTTVIFKTDKKLKQAAQATAKRMGIPFSAVMNGFLEDFVERQEITFFGNSPTRTAHFQRIVDSIREKEARKSEV